MLKSIKPSGILAFLMWMRQFGGLFLPCVGLLACTMIQPIQNPTQVYAYHASGQVPGQSIVNDSPGIMRRIFEKIYLSQPFQAGCATIEVLNTYTHSNDFLQQL